MRNFKAARLDTGFIARFNERRKAVDSKKPDQTREDIAVIAAAIHYVTLQREASANFRSGDSQSRWKMSGRHSRMKGSTAVNVKGKRAIE